MRENSAAPRPPTILHPNAAFAAGSKLSLLHHATHTLRYMFIALPTNSAGHGVSLKPTPAIILSLTCSKGKQQQHCCCLVGGIHDFFCYY